ncbi:hypothetical protein TCON_1589 [Astathelohania contejeani]|uniref:Reverse transcriptase n=1 Tax=Astathelohania contejeani TaxID=164912 RepID=A0ABQ7HYB9_9MICR|nr:hypothetical protein TCON_1589 [Thelohania contejeani]
MKYGNIDFCAEGIYCYIQDRNVFWRDDALQCQHCGKAKKSIDHLATGCDQMLGHDYTQRHNEVLRCINLLLANKYYFKKSKKPRIHSVQEVMKNEKAEIRVDTRIRTNILIKNNGPDIFIYDKKENEIILVEVGITSQDNLQIVETDKKRKYDFLANELGLLYKAKTKIIPYVMT